MLNTSSVRRGQRLLSIVWLTVMVGLLGAATAHADGPTADTYVFEGELGADGILKATETITFSEAPDELVQRIALESPIDDSSSFAYEVSDVTASVGGAEANAEVTRDGDYLVIALDTSEAADQPVTISYEVSGATRTEQGATGELTLFTWRALQGLNVGVAEVSGTIRVGAIPELIDCLAGPPGAVVKCELYAAGTHDAPMPIFQSFDRGVGEQVTITVGVSSGAVAATDVVREDWSMDRAFAITPLTVLTALGALALGALALYLLHRRSGTDLHHDDQFIPVASFRPVGEGESVFEIHEGVRPGHVGTVADERVDPVDVTATLLDLAVRGHLLITELPHDQHGLLDWKLTRTETGGDELARYETQILDAIAPVGGETLVSKLPATLTPVIGDVQDSLYDEVVARGWFESRPDSTRSNWRRIGIIGVIVAAVVAGLLVAFTNFGLLGLVLVVLALGLVWVGDRMPRRTKKGAKLVSGLGALSSLLATHPTDNMPAGRELPEISRLLPYAVVLGGKERWLDAIVRADNDATPDPAAISWYHAPATWHLKDLPASLTQFIHTVQGELFAR
ncbi:DUF2207 domain-containing protein [Tessaracoccus sp. OS52]|uniref:DUF2207 family protein n=1 Tax=Tessaracoccus sp. OS52 TaxID=2886691 RepID=UPI001D109304|nr:DUF2207 domain-containing protein [Tessaracoccus sp. OS52]MCC2591979.1 DUF2207 domain-containing protein [Tessaracoccus sp. OS52]